MSGATSTFYFDGDCGFCQWSAEKLQKLTVGELIVKPAWAGGHPGTPPEIATHIATHAVYLRLADDSDESAAQGETKPAEAEPELLLGHKGIGQCLIDHGTNPAIRIAGRVLTFPPLGPLFAGIYRLIAMNRHKLGPLVGVQACRIN